MSSDAVSSTPVAFRLRWDVFLSFRGEDTRHTITRNLYDSLRLHGVRVFLDDDGLDRGDEIAPSLLEAIDDSAAAVVILSENYASSHWCLEELAKICECKRLVLPVFYRVDPSDVRRQRGRFDESFKNLELDGRFGEKKIRRWRDAMEKVGGFAGYPFTSNSKEEDLVKGVVKKVLAELSNTPIGVATYRVGLDSRVEELVKKLDVNSNGSQILVLYGPGGVGKTTLAKALYNKLVSRFEHRSFISNVREISAKDNGLVSLQNKVMGDLSSSGTAPPVNEVNAGIRAIKNIVHENRVLVVYDDVNNVNQLEALAGIGDWFYKGSVVIITTRDREVLPEDQVNNIWHEVRELDSSEALQLFSYHALGREKPSAEFLNLSEQIVSLTGGLPLALEVFGSFLFDKRRTDDWQDALQKLKQIRPTQLHDVLKISYDDLDEQVKRIFLDIACFFVKMEMKREEAIDILKGCGFGAEIAVTVLVAKSLVKIIEGNTLWMHDQLREMGSQIVQHENLLDPGMRSRLWNRDEIMTVLKDSKGTRSVEGIILDFEGKNFVNELSGVRISWENFRRQINFTSLYTHLEERYKKCLQDRTEKEREVILRTKPFEAMVNLRLLQINYVKVEGSFKFLSAGLKWLQWKGCPLKTLPSDFCPRGLAVLDLSKSKIERVWGSFSNKVAENLLVMNLGGCYNLIDIPDLSGHQRLEKLVLERCNGLIKIHESIGNISALRHLNLRECSNLTCFPSNVYGLKHLENFVLSGCSKLKELPDIGSMKSLKVLLADGTAISELPESIFHLTKLEKLSLDHCQSLTRLPECIGKLISLKELSLAGSSIEELPHSVGSLANLEKLYLTWCKSLAAIPDSVGNLKMLTEIFVNRSAIKELPASIGLLPFLKNLSVGHCRSLVSLPDSIEGLASMVELELDGTSITDLPPHIGTLKMLEKLEMRDCTSLKSLPESIGNIWTLTTLIISSAKITELPESIGMLENLNMLSLNKCKQLCKIPASIGNLKSLYHLLMEDTAVTELPESFGMLSSLVRLKMAKKPQSEMPGQNDKDVVLPSSFSNLSSLIELDARAWKLSGKIPDDFERLTSLEVLNLGKNKISSLPPSLRSMSTLEKLFLPHCKELESLPLLPSSLLELNASNCTVLENIPDLSNLKNLQELNLTNCEKLVDIPGLECLESLRRLYMSGCSACSLVVKRLSKASLKKLSYLSMPGSKIPEWFSQDAVTFSECKNRALKAVIICVVVSVNHQIPDDLRDELPGIVDIQGSITQLNKPIYSAALNLEGVPNTDEDQFHLCRYPESHPFVLKLKDGYKIQVRRQPIVKGVELKKSGIHLVLEGADDYDGDEESLDPSQHSVSQKLAKFFSSFEEDNSVSISESGNEVAANTLEEAEGINKRTAAKCTNYYASGFIVLPLILLILSWLFYLLPIEHH